MRALIAVVIGLVGGLALASQGGGDVYAQSGGTDWMKPVMAIAAIAMGFYFLRSLSSNSYANFAGFVLVTGGFSYFLGALVFPTPPQPVNPQQPASYGSLEPAGDSIAPHPNVRMPA